MAAVTDGARSDGAVALLHLHNALLTKVLEEGAASGVTCLRREGERDGEYTIVHMHVRARVRGVVFQDGD